MVVSRDGKRCASASHIAPHLQAALDDWDRVQPELKKLQAQYKEDKEGLQREMMAFYQANNINPFSSCLPLLLQMPVFIVLFRVLRGLTGKTDSEGFFVPSYLREDSAMYKALRHSKEMRS